MTKISFSFFSNLKGKKIEEINNKKEINLWQKVVGLEEFKELSVRNDYPLAVAILKQEYESLFKNNNLDNSQEKFLEILETDYYKTCLAEDEKHVYMVLDVKKLELDFYENKIHIDKLVLGDGTIRWVISMHRSGSIEVPTRIGTVSKRKLFFKESDIEIVSLFEMTIKLIQDYVKNVRKKIVLTQEEIDAIHAKGKITSAEKVREWESLGLCAPGDTIGSAAYRCKEFNHDCHECLVDYASDSIEHDSIYSDIKITNSFCDEDTEDEKLKLKI